MFKPGAGINLKRMSSLKLTVILLFLLTITECEKDTNLSGMTANARITGFVAEKCFCCWGWVIEIDSKIIKSENIPGLSLEEDISFPINVRISLGEQTQTCDEYSKPAYYEVLQCTVVK
jgi:hypothetical protein